MALSTTFTQYTPGTILNSVKYRKIRAISTFKSFKVTHIGTNRKLIFGFLYIKTIAIGKYCALSFEFMNE